MVQIEKRQSIVLLGPERSEQFDDEGGEGVTDQTFLDLKQVCGKDKKLLEKLDTNGDGKIDIDEVLQCILAKKKSDKGRTVLGWSLGGVAVAFVIILGAFAGILHLQFQANKDTLVDPSTGRMTVKTPLLSSSSSSSSRRFLSSWTGILSDVISSSSSFLEDELDKSSSRLLEDEIDTTVTADVIDVTIRADGKTYSPDVIEGMNCYSQEAVTGMFVSVANGVTTTLTETNQTTNEFHVHQLGTSGCPNSDIVWSENDVRMGCVRMVPSLDCTNMARRDRNLSELDDEDTMQDHHRSLKEHVANNIAGGGGTAVNHNHRSLYNIWYFAGLFDGSVAGFSEGYAAGYAAGQAADSACPGVGRQWHLQTSAGNCLTDINNARRWAVRDSETVPSFPRCFYFMSMVGGCITNYLDNPTCQCTDSDCGIDPNHNFQVNDMGFSF